MDNPYDPAPWLRYYGEGVPRDIDVPNMPVTQLLDDAAERFPRNQALVFFGHTISYKRLHELVDRAAAGLAGLGVRGGDRVALILPNCPQQVIAFYAVLRLGAIVVQCNPLYTAPELEYQLADSESTVAIALDRVYPTLAEARPATKVREVIMTSLLPWLPRGKRFALKLPGTRPNSACAVPVSASAANAARQVASVRRAASRWKACAWAWAPAFSRWRRPPPNRSGA